ncbi:MAG: potassium transporter TrkG [Bacteroidota bacterium]
MKLINPLIILRILSIILLIASITFLLCIPVALIYNEPLFPFLWSSLAAFITYGIFRLVSFKADTVRITTREGFLAVTLSWLVFTLIGSLPYIISGSIPSFINAWFESTSGYSTTGASILTEVEVLPYSILFYRSLSHWIGGLGIIVLVIIILPSLKVSGYQLFSLESSIKEKIHPKTQAVGIRVLIIYLGLTFAEVIMLWLGDMTFFDSLCHSFGTIATGGFSTKNNSLQFYSDYSQYVVMTFMFLAGISQVVYYYLLKFNLKKVRQNEELWFYFTIVFIAGVFATLILFSTSGRSLEDAFRNGYFQVISILTCTGFASDDYLLWPAAGSLLIFILMFSGGMTGSTSGGIKMARHLIVLKNIKNTLLRMVHPKALASIKLNGRLVTDSLNNTILTFIFLYIFIFIIGTVIVVITGIDPVSSASSVATCMAGIGPGLGTVGPMNNYAHLPDVSKVVLSLLMIIGRLEIITAFALFSKSFWKI